MRIYVTTKSNTLTAEQKAEIISQVNIVNATGVSCEVTLAKTLGFSMTAEAVILKGYDKDKISTMIEERIRNVVSQAGIGEGIELSRIRTELADIKGIVNCRIYSPLLSDDKIKNNTLAVVFLKNLKVSCVYE